MRRQFVAAFVCCLCLCITAGNSFAKEQEHDLWGWLDQFSGPGPFNGYGVEAFKACKTNTHTQAEEAAEGPRIFKSEWRLGNARRPKYCVWADQRFFSADENDTYPRVEVKHFDQGLSYSWSGLIEAGVGFGVIRFHSTAAGGDVITHRATLTPVRLTVHPFNILFYKDELGPRERKVNALLNVPELYYRLVCVPGKLNGANFGVAASTYHGGRECVESYGVNFNLHELLRLK